MQIFNWNDEKKLKEIIDKNYSQSAVIAEIGLSNKSSGNYQTLQKYIKKYKINISHFYAQSFIYEPKNNKKKPKNLSNEEFFIENDFKHNGTVRDRILKYKLKDYICKECSSIPFWNNKKLVLQLDHINGQKDDNRLENLRFLCPNCHSQTETYGKAKQIEEKEFNFEIFNKKHPVPNKEEIIKLIKNYGYELGAKELKISKKIFNLICLHYKINIKEIFKETVKRTTYPSNEELQKKLLEKTINNVAKDLNCSDNGLKKHMKKNNLFNPSEHIIGYWTKLKSKKLKPIIFEDLIFINNQYQLKTKTEKLNPDLLQNQLLSLSLDLLQKNYPQYSMNELLKIIKYYKLFCPTKAIPNYFQRIKRYNKFPPITMSDLYLDENGAYQLKPEKILLYQK